jgi:ornithine cyclodeaminase
MKYISSEDIIGLNITPHQALCWVKEALLYKEHCQLPPKISVHPQGIDFFTTMPCLLPKQFGRFGCKVVSRINGNHPALKSELMLFNSNTGNLEAVVNCDWITATRTGAVAALAIKTFQNSKATDYSFIGLGSTARATLKCLLAETSKYTINIRLFKYKDQAEKIIDEFGDYSNVNFSISNSIDELVCDTDVLVSCITEANGFLVENTKLLKPGILIVPVHTRGFQNCDTIFDKVFADDTSHVKGFKYFDKFKQFHELSDVLKGTCLGRTSDDERILSYNVGLGLHDVYFATKIVDLLSN